MKKIIIITIICVLTVTGSILIGQKEAQDNKIYIGQIYTRVERHGWHVNNWEWVKTIETKEYSYKQLKELAKSAGSFSHAWDASNIGGNYLGVKLDDQTAVIFGGVYADEKLWELVGTWNYRLG